MGVACRVPDARNHREFFANLCAGRNSVREIDASRWKVEDYFAREGANKTFSKWCAQLDDPLGFDAEFFRVSPREARLMDPQQRLLLQESWRCVEDSGIPLSDLQRDRTSVLIGVMARDHLQKVSEPGLEVSSHSALGAYDCLLANRVSHFLGLRGGSFALDAACASSLVAVHLGVCSLLQGDADYVLAGGVSLNLHPWKYISFSQARMLSPDGQCATFDRAANGYVPGDGVGVLLLRRLADAERDRDHIYGVIRGSAVNHNGDGRTITAPSVEAQREVIEAAIRRAGWSAQSISYVEAHGTGTSLGDPVEVEALRRAFGKPGAQQRQTIIGSVKANIGHLEAAAGVVGLIKVLMMMRERKVPPSINVAAPNPLIAFDDGPFLLARAGVQWRPAPGCQRLRAGVSSFGMGGANCHVVVEDCPRASGADVAQLDRRFPFVLSAKSAESLRALVAEWLMFAREGGLEGAALRDVCATSTVGRVSFEQRAGALVASSSELLRWLETSPNPAASSGEPWALVLGAAEPGDGVRDQAIVVRRLGEYGFTPDCVCGTGAGVWGALAASGMLGWESVMAAAAGEPDTQQLALALTRPNTDFWDPVGERFIPPFLLDGEYVRCLVAALAAGEAGFDVVIQQADPLIAHQHTFRNYLEEWNTELSEAGLGSWCVPLASWGEVRRQRGARQTLWALAVQNSLDRLHAKWGLERARPKVAEARAGEWLDLMLDGVLSRCDAIELVAKAPDVERLLASLRRRARQLQPLKPYRLLRSRGDGLPELGDKAAWLAALRRAAGDVDSLAPALGPMQAVVLGDDVPWRAASEPLRIAGEQALQDALLGLWLRGVPIRWQVLFPPASFARISAPTYVHQGAVEPPRAARVPASTQPHAAAGSAALVELEPRWAECDVVEGSTRPAASLLVLGGDELLAEAAGRTASGAWCQSVNWVSVGSGYSCDRDRRFSVRADARSDYQQMFAALRARGELPTEIIHLGAFGGHPDSSGEALWVRSLSSMLWAFQGARPERPLDVLFVQPHDRGLLMPELAMATGLGKCLEREAPELKLKVVALDAGIDAASVWDRIEQERARDGSELVMWRGNQRRVRVFAAAPEPRRMGSDPLSWVALAPEGSVCVIAGGMGGIGRHVANWLLSRSQARVVLVGRSAMAELGELARFNVAQNERVRFIRADIGQLDDVVDAIDTVRRTCGPVSGVIQCAGVLRDAFHQFKDDAQFAEVLEPKLRGTLNLDRATARDELRFFVMFSSIVALTGNEGQSDYAAANAFLDAFAPWRNRQVERGERFGKTTSISWPLWRSTGMRVADGRLDTIFSPKSGLSPLPPDIGLAAFERALGGEGGQKIVLYGERERVEKLLEARGSERTKPQAVAQQGAAHITSAKRAPAVDDAEWYVRRTLARLLELPAAEIDLERGLDQYGIDSILVGQFNQIVEAELGQLSKTILFECRTLAEVASYLAARRGEGMHRLRAEAGELALGAARAVACAADARDEEPSTSAVAEPVAVIGMSGRFPMAASLEQFWDNLRRGRDCISPIPTARWGYAAAPNAELEAEAGMYCRWGGFLEQADCFDPLFFNISPREAELMDPQERIFLETAWHALEDAGYPPSRLKGRRGRGLGSVGVFVGVTTNSYSLWGASGTAASGGGIPTSLPWAIANRVSYFFDLDGPSMPVDTACAASLTAIHLACNSLASGECSMALVGGVNLYPHPQKYEWLCEKQMLSRRGRCQAFGALADGFVPGEGVAAVVLKPLRNALRDGDEVLGVIAGTAVNHGGRTSAFNVPSPMAQADLVAGAIVRSGVNADAIGYVEAHGTGTILGDPIEINGLTRAFRQLGRESRRACAIGSVKTNIGHLESAAGIAGVIKVLLQIRERTLVPSLHSERLNDAVDFSEGPFYVQQACSDWPAPVSSSGATAPRSAGVSSFGAGGANAHVVIQEFTGKAGTVRGPAGGPHIIALSARDERGLRESSAAIGHYLGRPEHDHHLSEVACQLLMRREHFSERVAFVASDVAHAARQLTAFGAGRDGSEPTRLWRSSPERRKSAGAAARLALNQRAADEAIERSHWEAAAEQWALGASLDAQRLYPEPLRHVPLPGYPFERTRYWVPAPPRAAASTAHHAGTHAILGERLAQPASPPTFAIQLGGDEFFLREHRVEARRILPAVAVIEVARAAAEALGYPVKTVAKSVFPVAIEVEAPRRLYIAMSGAAPRLDYEVYSEGPARERVTHSQGQVHIGTAVVAAGASGSSRLGDIQARCTQPCAVPDFYARIHALGLQLGADYRGIRRLQLGRGEALSEIELPAGLPWGNRVALLHPILFDSALQASLALIDQNDGTAGLHIPFTLGEVDVLGAIPKQCWAHVRLVAATAQGKKVEVRVLAADGQERVRVNGFWLRPWHRPVEAGPVLKAVDHAARFFTAAWVQRPLPEAPARASVGAAPESDVALIFVPRGAAGEQLAARLAPNALRVSQSEPRGDSPRALTLDLDERERFRQLLDTAAARRRRLDIVFAWPCADGLHIDDRDSLMRASLLPLWNLAAALIQHPEKPAVRLLHVHREGSTLAAPVLEAAAGFLRSAARELPRLTFRTLQLDGSEWTDSARVSACIGHELRQSWPERGEEVRYRSGARWVKEFHEAEALPPAPQGSPLRRGGVYLVTGALGGIGRQVCRFLLSEYHARVVAVGRSPLGERGEQLLAEARAAGGELVYISGSISSAETVAAARQAFGLVNGVFHCAGVLDDGLIVQAGATSLHDVLSPKIDGTLCLHQALSEEPIDITVYFSSIASVLGSVGQAHYGFANAFLDAFAEWREARRRSGQRLGRTLSINWPLWRSGGMQVDSATVDAITERWGLRPLETQQALGALRAALASDRGNVLFVPDAAKVRELLRTSQEEPGPERVDAGAATTRPELGAAALLGALQARITGEVGAIAKLDPGRIDVDADIASYGLDSIGLTRLANQLNAALQVSLTPATFFEYTSTSSLAGHLAEVGGEALRSRLLSADDAATEAVAPSARSAPGDAPAPAAGTAPAPAAPSTQSVGGREPIAIIGMHGVMPQSRNLEEFWRQLVAGRDMISEVPSERWPWRKYFGDPLKERNKTNSKWGGFISDVDCFDASFFGISPREAELMDPQQRVFLETVYKTIEDAGYRPSALAKRAVGLFVGVATHDYNELLRQADIPVEAYTTTGLFHAILANRVSYLLNFTGPSFPIDTACSSSLVALRSAVEAIWSGSCELAIAGGVNLLLAPMIFISFARAGMLSPDGRCKTFDKSANGYVRGEGAGAMLLKPLSKAIQDGDHIHGVIRSVVVNHGGRVHSLTAPNPNAQAELVANALEEAGVDPETIGYVEMHGTGTALGDPIEVNGLKKAFRKVRERLGKPELKEGRCGIGSVKTNIGHLEAAAGMAGMFKVLLAMKHGHLPGLVNFEELNPHIDLSDGPLRLVQSGQAWTRIESDAGTELPRRAGVSSFGFGGVNGHVVLEEFVTDDVDASPSEEQVCLVLSARSPERLRAQSRELSDFLRRGVADAEGEGESAEAAPRAPESLLEELALVLGVRANDLALDEPLEDLGLDALQLAEWCARIGVGPELLPIPTARSPRDIARIAAAARGHRQRRPALNLRDIAFTLQTGREERACRLALIGASPLAMASELERFASSGENTGTLSWSQLSDASKASRSDERELVSAALLQRDIASLARHWLRGSDVDWSALYRDRPARRVSLPTYPFERVRHWAIPADTDTTAAVVHPLLGSGCCIEREGHAAYRVRATLSPALSVVRDHLVNGRAVLPGVAHLELARAALSMTSGDAFDLEQVVWRSTLEVDADVDVEVELRVASNGVSYSIQKAEEGPRRVYSTGRFRSREQRGAEAEPALSIPGALDRCARHLDRASVYGLFALLGLDYGTSLRGIQEAWIGPGEALARVSLADAGEHDGYVLHPTLLDAALQLIAAIEITERSTGAPTPLPFSVESVTLHAPLAQASYAHAQRTSDGLFRVVLSDDRGTPCLVLGDVCVRERNDALAGLCHVPSWQPVPASPGRQRPDAGEVCWVVTPRACHGVDEELIRQWEQAGGRAERVELETGEPAHEAAGLAPSRGVVATLEERVRRLPLPSRVFYLGGVAERHGALDESPADGTVVLFHLVKLLLEHGVLARLRELAVVSSGAHSVDGRRAPNPGAAGLAGFCQALAREYPRLSVRCADLDIADAATLSPERRRSLVGELLHESPVRSGQSVVRRGAEWLTQKLRPLRLPRASPSAYRRGGHYLIVGGAQGIGAVVAQHLAQNFGARLVLTGRRLEDSAIQHLVRGLRASGAEARYVRADVASLEDMRHVVREAGVNGGPIHGVFHAAMVLHDGIVESLDEAQFVSALLPKLRGAQVLATLFEHADLDFMLFMSSVQSFVGAAGQSNYAAASTALDALAGDLASRTTYPVRTVNWGYWGSVGRVASEKYRQQLEQRGYQSIEPNEGLEAIDRVLVGEHRRVVVLRAAANVLEEIGVDLSLGEPPLPLDMVQVAPLSFSEAEENRERELQRCIGQSLVQRLHQAGVSLVPRRVYSEDELRVALGAGVGFERAASALGRVLAQQGILESRSGRWRCLASLDNALATDQTPDLVELAARLEREPSSSPRLRLARDCIAALPDVIAGRLRATEVLFPGGSFDAVAAVYRGERLVDYCNHLVAQSAVSVVRRLGRAPRHVRVLELGAGTGATTDVVCARLAAEKIDVEYHFTDCSRLFVERARQRFSGAASGLEFAVLDIEGSDQAPGGPFDIIIAANVVHATRSIDASLARIRSWLKPGGWFLLNEVTRVTPFHTVTFGLLDGWWLYSDGEVRQSGGPILDAAQWRQRLRSAGFSRVGALGRSSLGAELPQRVIVAECAAAAPGGSESVAPAAAVLTTAITNACSDAARDPRDLSEERTLNASELENGVRETLTQIVARCLKAPPASIDPDRELAALGVDSIVGLELISLVNDALGTLLRTIVIFDYPTLRLLSRHIAEAHREKLRLPRQGAASMPVEAVRHDGVATDPSRDPDEVRAPPAPAPERRPSTAPQRQAVFSSEPAVSPLTAQPRLRAADVASGPRAVRFERPGSPHELSIVTAHTRAPEAGQVEIDVKAFPINFSDFLLAKGLYPIMPEFPFTPGVEVSGVVRRVGPGVTRVAPGDAVIALTRPEMGGQASRVVTDESFVVAKPRNVSHAEACGFPVAFLAMYLGFERANVQRGEKVLIQAATGTNGLVAVQLARAAGAEILATAGSAAKAEYLLELGVQHVIDYSKQDIAREVAALTGGRGVDVVISTMGGQFLQQGLDSLAPEGRYIELAVFGLQATGTVNLAHLVDNQTFHSLNTKKFFLMHPEKRVRYLEIMAAQLASGRVRPTLAATFPFDAVREAYAAKESRSTIGRIVVSFEVAAPEEVASAPQVRRARGRRGEAIAIVGLACRVPGADDARQFWRNLANGHSAIREIPPQRWSNERFFHPDPARLDKTYCRFGGFLDGIDRFDADFFNVSGKEAAQMDPQQRVFMEEAWHALEDAGYSRASLAGQRCGVFVGVGASDYLTRMNAAGVIKEAQSFWGNEASVLAARMSYFLNLRGPSIAINTACSSSLVALHVACQSIRSGESDMALAGGIFLYNAPDYFIVTSNGQMISRDGKCKTFDQGADGFGPGEGAGAVVLKPLEVALAEGDRIYGIVRGSAINQDGKTNGITAPSGLAQTEVELAVYEGFGIDPDHITLVEAHGTGTKLGDPIEVQALSNAFRKFTQRRHYCAIGSAKTNIGHAAAAAGIVGAIKVLLAFQHRKLPASINFERANEHIDFESSPFFVNTRLSDWEPADGHARLAAVSSFGFSGTNAHAVLEEPPEPAPSTLPRQRVVCVPLSGTSEAAVARRRADLVRWLSEEGGGAALEDVAWNLQTRRDHLPVRLAYVAATREELLRLLADDSVRSGRVVIEPLNAHVPPLTRELAEAYSRGEHVDWAQLHGTGRGRVLSLPGYPFEPDVHWFSREDRVYLGAEQAASAGLRLEGWHATDAGYAARVELSDKEFFLSGHRVSGRSVLPAAWYLELGERIAERLGFSLGELSGLRFERPFFPGNEAAWLHVKVSPSADGAGFEAFSQDVGGSVVVHARGMLRALASSSRPSAPAVDLDALRLAASRESSPSDLYASLLKAGVAHGPEFRAVSAVWVGPEDVMLTLERAAVPAQASYVLHPALVDGAMQGLSPLLERGSPASPKVPIAVARVAVFCSELPARCFGHVRRSQSSASQKRESFDVRWISVTGELLLEMTELTVKAAGKPANAPSEGHGWLEILRRLEAGEIDEEDAERALEGNP